MEISEVNEAFLRSVDVHGILPQQEPFVMIDTLVHFEMLTSTTETLVRPSNILVDGDRLSAFGMMENIAQTCAARIGFYNKYILNKDVQVGYIGAVRDYTVSRRPRVGEMIVTTVDVIEEIFGMTLAKATILSGDEVLATAQIKLSVKDAA